MEDGARDRGGRISEGSLRSALGGDLLAGGGLQSTGRPPAIAALGFSGLSAPSESSARLLRRALASPAQPDRRNQPGSRIRTARRDPALPAVDSALAPGRHWHCLRPGTCRPTLPSESPGHLPADTPFIRALVGREEERIGRFPRKSIRGKTNIFLFSDFLFSGFFV